MFPPIAITSEMNPLPIDPIHTRCALRLPNLHRRVLNLQPSRRDLIAVRSPFSNIKHPLFVLGVPRLRPLGEFHLLEPRRFRRVGIVDQARQ